MSSNNSGRYSQFWLQSIIFHHLYTHEVTRPNKLSSFTFVVFHLCPLRGEKPCIDINCLNNNAISTPVQVLSLRAFLLELRHLNGLWPVCALRMYVEICSSFVWNNIYTAVVLNYMNCTFSFFKKKVSNTLTLNC